MSEELTGLDGSNPLGFFAALGVLRWLTVHGGTPGARLAFRDGTWRAVLHEAPPVADWAATLAADAKAWLQRPHLTFSYTKQDTVVHDLKPPPELFRAWLQELRRNGDHEVLAFAMGYAAERGLDASTGLVIKPTALHFTAGKQQFLTTVQDVASSLTVEDVNEALFGPWRYARKVKSLSWDATVSRNYALRASDPAAEKRLGNPGADWLAFLALPLFPVVARGPHAQTAGVTGTWKRGAFQWPLWGVPAHLDAVSDLLVLPNIDQWGGRERRLRGLVAVFRSDIARSDQGGYGAFGPARIAW